VGKEKGKEKKQTSEKPISLYPMKPEEALRKLLQIHPPYKKRKKPKRDRA